jgi:protease II
MWFMGVHTFCLCGLCRPHKPHRQSKAYVFVVDSMYGQIFCTATRQNEYFFLLTTSTLKYLCQTTRQNKYFFILNMRTAGTVAQQQQKQHCKTIAQQQQKQLEKTAQMQGLEINPNSYKLKVEE